MSKVNTGFFIAKRISGPSSPDRKNVMVRIATLSVAISVSVMIIAVAVVSGFKKEITGKLVGFGSHVQIVNMDGNSSYETTPITVSHELEKKLAEPRGMANFHTYAVKGGIIKTEEAMQGIMLKGVGIDYDWEFFNENLVSGEIPAINEERRKWEILISEQLSKALRISTGDKVEILFVRGEMKPLRYPFRVTGLYETGLEELDMTVVITDIRNVQYLNGWDASQITGYEITTTDFSKLKEFSAKVYDKLIEWEDETDPEENLMMLDITERYPNLFDWLKAHDVNTIVIIVIMLLVALLNMITALLIILLERIRMIGVLKALGMDNGSLQKMFLMRSGFILLKGIIWGNILGIGICLLQKYTHLIKLSQSGYFLSEVPVNLAWGWIAGINIGTFIIILLLLIFPTNIISKIQPEKTIRYQ